MDDALASIDTKAASVKKHECASPALQPDDRWCEMLASYSADEPIARKLIQPEDCDFAMRIIRQQAYVLLLSNATRPAT